MMSINSLAAQEAYEEKQAAYFKMQDAKAEMNSIRVAMEELYTEIGALQGEFDIIDANTAQDWEVFKGRLDDYNEKIVEKSNALQEAKDLREKFEFLATENGDYGRGHLYNEAVEFFRQKALLYEEEKKALLAEKEAVRINERPDTSERDAKRENLKAKRGRQATLKSQYGVAKDKFMRCQAEFRLKQEAYRNLLNFGKDMIVDEEKERLRREKILEKAGVPKEFWETATIKEHDNGADVYYGGDKDHAHGHIALFNDEVTYSREPRESTKL